mmetsp:Transcript_49527/g.112159  ORF Transcript_49527/g.112159 Transcript_49527/m.112159 type:complete len:326 (-) Transcript_49527:197-1174(-)
MAASLWKASGAACAKLLRGEARFTAYAAGILSSGSWLERQAITAGMSAGHTGSDCSFKCLSNSQPRKRAKTLLSFVPNHVIIRVLHSCKQGRKSAGATSMMWPMASTIVWRRSSSSLSELSSSSSSCSSGGAPAAPAFLASWICFVLMKDLSMETKNFCTIWRTSWAPNTPGPQFLTHSPTPSMAARRVSGSSSWSMLARTICKKVLRSSAATPVLVLSAFSTHLMSWAQTWKAVPLESSYKTACSSVGLMMGINAFAVPSTKSRKAPSISTQKVRSSCRFCSSSSNFELFTFTSLPSRPTVICTYSSSSSSSSVECSISMLKDA